MGKRYRIDGQRGAYTVTDLKLGTICGTFKYKKDTQIITKKSKNKQMMVK